MIADAITLSRSLLFEFLRILLTIVFSFVAISVFFLPPVKRYIVISYWAKIIIPLSRVICGVNFRILGGENIPKKPTIILSNHQSAWETFAFQLIFPPQVWLLRKSLLKIPFFGWGLAMTSPIAIDRKLGTQALRDLVRQGKQRIKAGFCVVIFPEGTRMAPGAIKEYQIGGAFLACNTNCAVTPVAHNAGTLWTKNAILKRPGVITISVGPKISPAGLTPRQLTRKVEMWIQNETSRLDRAKEKADRPAIE